MQFEILKPDIRLHYPTPRFFTDSVNVDFDRLLGWKLPILISNPKQTHLFA